MQKQAFSLAFWKKNKYKENDFQLGQMIATLAVNAA